MTTTLRAATAADVAIIGALIRELAVYEKLADQAVATDAELTRWLFGERPAAEVVLAERDGAVVAFALFFTNFSTFLGKPGLYLEDLFVQPSARGHSLGRALMIHLAQLAVARGYGRFEWSVLDWNTPAIDFYRRLGAVAMDGWTGYRVAGDALAALAQVGNA